MENTNYFIDWNKKGKNRPKQHIWGEVAITILKDIFPKHWVVREYQPDYGIDLNIELFENIGNDVYRTLGEYVLFQVKGTKDLKKNTVSLYSRYNTEKKYKEDRSKRCTMDVIKYSIDTELLVTVEKMGSAVPVLLTVVDIEQKMAYFVCLNDYIEKVLLPTKPDFYKQNTVTINIPVRNCLNTEAGKHIIEWYGKRPKLYSFFNKVHYQLTELNYTSDKDYKEQTDHFFKIICRLDVWSAINYFPALKIMKDEIDYYLKNHNTLEADIILKHMIDKGEDVDSEIYEATFCSEEVSYRHSVYVQSLHSLWEKLCNVADVFEEDSKELFLPTFFYAIM